MEDLMEQQMVNELTHILKGLNETYKELFHVKLLTIIDLKDESCQDCIDLNKKCLRCIVGFNEKGTDEISHN